MIIGLLLISMQANIVLTYLVYRSLRTRLALIQDDVSAIRIRSVPVDVGGRLAPSVAELQAAKNRMDKFGTAQSGGPG
jgi:hypothetical protein